jgi:hypothetical protein
MRLETKKLLDELTMEQANAFFQEQLIGLNLYVTFNATMSIHDTDLPEGWRFAWCSHNSISFKTAI